jgi:Flp pilus assembly protein TadG
MTQPASDHCPCRAPARRRLCDFWQSDDGSATVESVIWFPIFALLLGLIMNISMVFFNESQILRVVQDGNRAFSLGRLSDAEAVETYVSEQLSYLEAALTIDSRVSGGFITTTLSAPATDLMPFNFVAKAFQDVRVGVSAQHIIEF